MGTRLGSLKRVPGRCFVWRIQLISAIFELVGDEAFDLPGGRERCVATVKIRPLATKKEYPFHVKFSLRVPGFEQHAIHASTFRSLGAARVKCSATEVT